MNKQQKANGVYKNWSEDNALISLGGVTKDYATPAGAFTALKDMDLRIKQGEFVAIVGKSGSGKSTLLNMITGIDRPTKGEVLINDTAVHKMNEDETAVWRGKNVGIVFQFYQLMPTLTVLENVMMPMDFIGKYSPKERAARALDLLTQVSISDQAHKFPSSLSGGQQQRVAIARALANDPAFLVADEPTGNLDSQTADDVLTLFRRLAVNGKTIVMVTHERDIAPLVDRVITLADGNIVPDDNGIVAEQREVTYA